MCVSKVSNESYFIHNNGISISFKLHTNDRISAILKDFYLYAQKWAEIVKLHGIFDKMKSMCQNLHVISNNIPPSFHSSKMTEKGEKR